MGNQRFKLEAKSVKNKMKKIGVSQNNHLILSFSSDANNAVDVTCSFVKEEKKFWSSSELSRSDRLIILSISALMIYLH